MPAAHVVHVRSAMPVPAALVYEPGRQSDHGKQSAAFEDVEYVPLGHARQERFVTAVPGRSTCSPALHVCQGTQAVAGLPS